MYCSIFKFHLFKCVYCPPPSYAHAFLLNKSDNFDCIFLNWPFPDLLLVYMMYEIADAYAWAYLENVLDDQHRLYSLSLSHTHTQYERELLVHTYCIRRRVLDWTLLCHGASMATSHFNWLEIKHRDQCFSILMIFFRQMFYSWLLCFLASFQIIVVSSSVKLTAACLFQSNFRSTVLSISCEATIH